MAVHDYGNIRIVSFLMTRTAAASREIAIAVVDVWMLSGDWSGSESAIHRRSMN
jgi:hypothetical protein